MPAGSQQITEYHSLLLQSMHMQVFSAVNKKENKVMTILVRTACPCLSTLLRVEWTLYWMQPPDRRKQMGCGLRSL